MSQFIDSNSTLLIYAKKDIPILRKIAHLTNVVKTHWKILLKINHTNKIIIPKTTPLFANRLELC